MFTKVFIDSAQECVPVKTVRVHTDDAPWMTNEIRLLIKQRGKMHKKAKRSNLKAVFGTTFALLEIMLFLKLGSVNLITLMNSPKKCLTRNVSAARIGGN